MNKLIIGLILGIIITTPLMAIGKLIINPVEKAYIVGDSEGGTKLLSTKVTTEEGTYRIFIYWGFRKGGITAIKIK